MSLAASHKLAYYLSAQEVGILAPRGWYCFGTYGSGGDTLFVSPQPIDAKRIFSAHDIAFSGPAIEVSRRRGDTSGRFDVAQVAARVFPSYRSFVEGVANILDEPISAFQFGPFPKDVLSYQSKTVVEYKTPAHCDGLGTRSLLTKNGNPISGVAILAGPTPDLLLLSARLPPTLAELTKSIVRQLEWDAVHGFGSK